MGIGIGTRSPVTFSDSLSLTTGNQSKAYSTVKGRLYIFVRGFRRAYKRRVLYPRGLITRIEKALQNKL